MLGKVLHTVLDKYEIVELSRDKREYYTDMKKYNSYSSSIQKPSGMGWASIDPGDAFLERVVTWGLSWTNDNGKRERIVFDAPPCKIKELVYQFDETKDPFVFSETNWRLRSEK